MNRRSRLAAGALVALLVALAPAAALAAPPTGGASASMPVPLPLAAPTVAGAAADPGTPHPVTYVITTDPNTTGQGTSDEQTARTGVRDQFDGWSQYWRTTSEGKVDFQLDGHYNDAATWWPGHGTCGSTGAQRSADYAAARTHVGFQSGTLKLFVLVVANCNSNQGYGGGSSVTSGGSVYYEGYTSKGVWAHEVGHTMGFGHGLRLSCTDGSVDGPILEEAGAATSGCSTYDYGDEVDVMGFSRRTQYKSFAAPHRVLEGFYGPESYFTVDSEDPVDQTLNVVPRALDSGKRAVVAKDPRSGTTYYFEYATPVGEDKGVVDNLSPDDFAGYTWIQKPGVRVLRESGTHAVLLTPPANAQKQRNMFWPVGTTFTSPDGGVSMNVVTQDDGSATLRVRSAPTVKPAPTTEDDTATRTTDDTTPIDVLANDNPPSGETLDATSLVFPDDGQPNGATVSGDRRRITVDGQGVYTIDPMSGAVTFTAADGYVGTADPVTYRVSASGGGTATATLTVTAEASTVPPAAPNAVDDTATRKADDRTPVDVLANDTADQSRTLDKTSVVFAGTGQPAGSTVSADGRTLTVTDQGAYSIDPETGAITLTPVEGYTGEADPVTYQVADDADKTDTATLTVTVTLPSGAAAQAGADHATTTQGQPVTTVVLANDNATGGAAVDPDSVVLLSVARQTSSPSGVVPAGRALAAAALDGQRELSTDGVGTAAVTDSGAVRFAPAEGFLGTAVISYGFTDAYGQDARSTLTVDVNTVGTPGDGDGGGTGGGGTGAGGGTASGGTGATGEPGSTSATTTGPTASEDGVLPGTGGPALALLIVGIVGLGAGALIVLTRRRSA